ncbi:MAG: carbohydrate ABC transporter permease [Spirochaetia bacterium]|jgi:putative aldouronate transport system permease protein
MSSIAGSRRARKTIRPGQVVSHIVFVLIALICLYPLLLVFAISFSDEQSIAVHGFKLIPAQFSLGAYSYMLYDPSTLIRAYFITIIVTVVGTLCSTLVIALYAYPLSRKDFRQKKFFSFFVFFTMLFSGGLVPWFVICKSIGLSNNLWALFVPYLMNAWYVLIMRVFYKTNVPDSIIESAKMDGAGEYTIFFRIIIYLAMPGLATIALFNAVGFWNDWWLPLMLVTKPEWYNLQYLMYRVQTNITYLSTTTAGGHMGEILQHLPSRTAQMAMCVLTIGPIILAYPFFQRFFVKGITLGSLKE